MSEAIIPRGSTEPLDVVDIYGRRTGLIREKQIIHDSGLRHRDTHVWLTNGQSFLQQRRTTDTSIMPGEWDVSVGGHVDAGESYRDAAVREAGEELGLRLPRERFIRLGLVASQLQLPGWEHPHNIVGDNFVVYQPGLQLADLTPQEEELQDIRWYSIDQLEIDLLAPDTAQQHAPQPMALYALGIAGMRAAAATT